jgi:pyruvate/2-oxoglutarate dehydrogenase complex dihydrolipoamide acyltransferase (E2) component
MTADSASQFMPLYRRASKAFGVNWRLIASIHQQETSFSSAPGTYHGLNFARCCAGPMQFNVTNGPVSTWERFRNAYRSAERPASYPHRTRKHPSVYDDFDAVMAAGALLRDNGAGRHLDGSAWLASYHYYGHDLTGLQYADQVLARAVGWTHRGLCVMCAVDPQLTARFDAAFAAPYRAELVAAQRQAQAAARAKARAKREARAQARRAARAEAKRRARARAAAAAKAHAASKKAHAASEKASPARAGKGSSESAAHTAAAEAATSASTPATPAPSQTTSP